MATSRVVWPRSAWPGASSATMAIMLEGAAEDAPDSVWDVCREVSVQVAVRMVGILCSIWEIAWPPAPAAITLNLTA